RCTSRRMSGDTGTCYCTTGRTANSSPFTCAQLCVLDNKMEAPPPDASASAGLVVSHARSPSGRRTSSLTATPDLALRACKSITSGVLGTSGQVGDGVECGHHERTVKT